MTRFTPVLLAVLCFFTAEVVSAQLSVTIRDISPDRSNNADPDGATGGRINRLGVDRSTPGRVFAASEFGGIFRSNDNGVTWAHVDGHVPTVTWDVKVDPTNSNRVYGTSFYDGRVNSRSGINVSTDGGVTWTHPATATPPMGSCVTDIRRTESAAFGIAIDPANTSRVFIGTNCGLAISLDAGVTWAFRDPTPADAADDVRDVIVHHGGIIDLCGDDGHRRSNDGGATWTTASSSLLPSGRCSLAASPDESYVLFAVVGTSIFESDDGGQTWPVTYTNPTPQGRIPFVATNKRAGRNFDLWFGDVSLFRGACTTPAAPATGGTQRCAASGAWAGPFTRSVGAHDDSGDIAFAPGVASNACPILFSSDGGVFRNTLNASPACHTPAWVQPNVTPHGLWNYTFTGVSRPGVAAEHLYHGNQDNGTFGAANGGASPVTWNNERCCDGFDTAGEATRGLTTVCCFGGGRATRLFLSGPGLSGASPEINSYPPGNMRSFEQLEGMLNFAGNSYVVATTAGVFVTTNIGASPVVWTQLGAATSPPAPCGLQIATSAGARTVFVKSGGCDGDRPGTVWRHLGTTAGSTWQQVPMPGIVGFGVFAVDPNDPQRLIASHLGATTGPEMVMTWNGGTTWSRLAALDALMTGSGTFKYLNQTGPRAFTALGGYPQPTLVAFDRSDADVLVAGGADSGVFISTNGGTRWQLVTDPISPGTSGVPHIPRPYYAHFDHDSPGGDINLYLGTRGRGVWRLTFAKALMPEIQVPSPPTFGGACAGSRQPGVLDVCNTSGADLVVTSITSSNPQFAIVPPSAGFPVTISHDFCFPFQLTFTPTGFGTQATTLTINSNDASFPALQVATTAVANQPAIATLIASNGDFGSVCQPGFRDADLTVENNGLCALIVSGIGSSSTDFKMASTVAFPLTIAPGSSLQVPVRFEPSSGGAKTGTLTVNSNDPVRPTADVPVKGLGGQPLIATGIADTGDFGSVCEGDFRDLPLTIQNNGACPLNISNISSSSPEFETPGVLSYPLTIASGTSIELPIRYRPTFAGTKSATITITSDDPASPSKTVHVKAATPQDYICHPPTFAVAGVNVGPTFGPSRTGDYSFSGYGRVLHPIGPRKNYGIQAQGEYLYYQQRQEGQFEAGLLVRHGPVQAGALSGFKYVHFGTFQNGGTLGQASFTLDFLFLPNARFGIFGAKGFRNSGSVDRFRFSGGTLETYLRVVDQLGAAGQVQLPYRTHLDGSVAWLHRHATGLPDRPGAMVRLVHQWRALGFLLEADFNETYIGRHDSGRVVFGVQLGRWPRPRDLDNRRNTLGTEVPRVHYEVLQRVR